MSDHSGIRRTILRGLGAGWLAQRVSGLARAGTPKADRLALALVSLAGALLASATTAMADGMQYPNGYRGILPPERHVIEGVRPPGSGVFLINGRYFASSACPRWVAGDRITLLAGDWNGYCETATFRNLRRGGTCTMWCR
jgi:hypothetical protein